MNPGPFGMAQTGVPFGDVTMVRDWLRIAAPVAKPLHEHPKRPVLGFECPRVEVSGTRLWGWARDRFGTPERFFRRFFVANYCPLAFMESSGANRTPDKLPAAEAQALFDACDESLRDVVRELRPRIVVGVGGFAERRARAALADENVPVGAILHPSPASPLANRGWAEAIEGQLRELGVAL
jgi:single-strand selective monofunctional uracil DNA glycosylase